MRTLLRAPLAAALLSVGLLAGCGTALVENAFSVRVEDPSGRLPDGPVEVSIFDSVMGQSDEWARTTMGTATATEPYRTSFTSTTAKMVGDHGPSERVTAGIAVPGYAPKGYFSLVLAPVDGQTVTVEAPFVGYYDYDAALDGPVPPLPLKVTSTAGDLSWRLDIVAEVPAAP